MTADDYLAIAERLIVDMPQYKDGGGYVPDYIHLGIGQQLRRIADVLERDQHDRLSREGYAL